MLELSSDHIEHLGRLSRIKLTEEERSRFASQLSSVVSYIDQITEVDTSRVGKLRGVTGLQNVFAADLERTPGNQLVVSREALLQGAPATAGEFIEVRAVMGDEVISA